MNLIYIADPQGHQQTYDPQDALRLWTEGVISRDSLYWLEGMTGWRPASEFFLQQAQDAVPPTMPALATRGFARDPARLTRWLIAMLWAYAVASGLSALLTAISLATGHAQKPPTDELSLYDVAGLLLVLPLLLTILVTGVMFLMWIHRANRNARALGAEGMTFTPGWSVGWHFVPFANLWKPYQAMKQIWQASANPASWVSQRPPPLLPIWWTLWIINNVLSNASFRMTMRADTGPELLAGAIVDLISDLVSIPLCLVAMRLVREIIRLQNHWAAQAVRNLESNCGICRQPMPSSEMLFLNNTWVCVRCKPILLQQIREGLGQ